MKFKRSYPDRVVVEVDQSDLHNLIGAMHAYRTGKIHLIGSPFELRLRALTDELRAVEKELHDEQARSRGLIVEGDEPVTPGAF